MNQSLTFRVQQFGHAEFLLRHVEGVLEVVSRVGPLQVVVLHQIWPRGGEDGESEKDK